MSHAAERGPVPPERAASAKHAGAILTVAGVLLLACSLAVLLIGAFVLTQQGTGRRVGGFLTWLGSLCLSPAPGVLSLFAVCFIIPGEQLRRGVISRGRTQAGRVRSQSEFRQLGWAWRVVWIVVGLTVSVFLIAEPVSSWSSRTPPSSLPARYDYTQNWLLMGSIVLGVTLAAIASAVKRIVYDHVQRSGRETKESGRAFWRWFGFRWRFDLWLAGAGGFLIGASPLGFVFDFDRDAPFDNPDGVAWAIGTISIGIVLIIAGIVTATQFWRSGESTGAGESLA